MNCTQLTPLACHPGSFPTLVAPAVITVPEGHSSCLHTLPMGWGTFQGPGSVDGGSPVDRDLESGKKALKRRRCPPWEPASLGFLIFSPMSTVLYPPSQGRPDWALPPYQGGSITVASQLAGPPQQASQVSLAEPERGAIEGLP